MEIPKQEKQETVPSFVMRACSIMEKTQKSGEGVKTSAKLAEEAAERRERMDRLESKQAIFKRPQSCTHSFPLLSAMTTAQIEAENTQMINDLYRLLKKYSGLRNLIRELKVRFKKKKLYFVNHKKKNERRAKTFSIHLKCFLC